MHIRPEAYLDKGKASEVSTDFIKDIEEKLGRPLTDEELITLSNSQAAANNDTIVDDDIDTIERI